MKIALIHDYLFEYAGSERVIEQILKIFPDADLFTLFDFLPAGSRGFLAGKISRTTFFQNIPFLRRNPPRFLPYTVPLMPFAVEQVDLSGYDLILSSSHSVAKAVLTGPGQLHIAYIHSPMRYAWDQYTDYTQSPALRRGVVGTAARAFLTWIRVWDYRTANGVDQFVANSQFIARRIYKVYRRESAVIYPPVNIESFPQQTEKSDYYLAVSRFVPYKRMDVIINAFREMPGRQLVVIGSGPEEKRLRKLAGDNIKFLGHQSQSDLARWMGSARALVQAAQEDFGITSIEAQSAGTPVIAYRRGAAQEIIRGIEDPVPTGIFFDVQSPEAVQLAVEEMEDNLREFKPGDCHENANRFRADRFRNEFLEFVETSWSLYHGALPLPLHAEAPHERT